MSTTIKGSLSNVDYKDTCERGLEPGTYDYTLKASGGGKLSFKAKQQLHESLGEKGKTIWWSMETKSKISSGTTLNGSFNVSPDLGTHTKVKFIFTRAVLSLGVDYVLTYQKK